MKILIVSFFLIVANVFSQGRASQYPGVDRSLIPQSEPSKKKPPAPAELLDASVKKLNESLSLDAFQSAAIRQMLAANMQREEQIIATDAPIESKTEQIAVLRDKLNDDIRQLLTSQQKEKFEALLKKNKRK